MIWAFENPEKIEKIKKDFKKNKKIESVTTANSFDVSFSKVLNLDDKTAFLIYPEKNKKFNISNLTIYTQTGFVINSGITKKLNLPKYFTPQRNGGIKTIISTEKDSFALISGNKKDCFFSSIISLRENKEIFRTECLPKETNFDFNGMGSSNVHFNGSILFSLGFPEKNITKSSLLAQDNNSYFGKILEMQKSDLVDVSKINPKNLKVNIFSKGHRVPQGLTVLNNKIFNSEHGPKGGDELNLVTKDKNYGFPNVSYGTNYLEDEGGDGKSIQVNHEKNNFEEPLFAFVPSVGISALNNCPAALINYYKKSCLMALSLNGNDLAKGHSLIIFLLNNSLDKVQSIEKIPLDDLVLRHFVTNKENVLYEDGEGNIYVSADKKGIYKIGFTNFR